MSIFELFKPAPRIMPEPSPGCTLYDAPATVALFANRERYVAQSSGHESVPVPTAEIARRFRHASGR